MLKFIAMMGLLLACISTSIAQWERIYGGSLLDIAYSVAQTTDGGFVVAGYTNSFGTSDDFYLVRTDALGDTLWTRTYGGANSDWGYSVAQTTDRGFIIAGRTNTPGIAGPDIFIVKTDSLGDTVWTRMFDGGEFDEARFVAEVSGGYIVVGYTNSSGVTPGLYYDVLLMKLDYGGDTIWTRTYGDTLDDGCFAGASKTDDGGYIITGKTNSFGAGDGNVYLVKVNEGGILEWQRAYGGSGNDEGWAVTQMLRGGYVIVGFSGSFGTDDDVYIIRTNSSGDTLWTRTYGDAHSDRADGVVQTANGNIAVIGTKGYPIPIGDNWYDIWLLMLDDSTGDTLWTKTYGGDRDDIGFDIAKTTDGGFIITGYTVSDYFGAISADVYLIKTDSLGRTGIEEGVKPKPQTFSINAYPNPFNSSVRIRIQNTEDRSQNVEIYDIAGKKVREFKGKNSTNIVWDGTDNSQNPLPNGIYFIKDKMSGKQTKAVLMK